MREVFKSRIAPAAVVAGFVAGLGVAGMAQKALSRPAHLADVLDGCVPCHGAEGIAPDTLVPNLAGQNSGYLIAQLTAFKTGKRKHPEMRFMVRDLSTRDIEALAHYFAELPPR